MRTKQYALVALMAWSGLIAWVAYMYLTQPSIRPYVAHETTATLPPQLQTSIARIEQSMQALANLRQIDTRPRSPTQQAIIALPRPGTSAGGNYDKASGKAVEVVVSLIVSGRQGRRAVIDGHYVQAGDTLKDGTVIASINLDSVELHDPLGLPRTVKLQHAYLKSEAP